MTALDANWHARATIGTIGNVQTIANIANESFNYYARRAQTVDPMPIGYCRGHVAQWLLPWSC
jgi:hypothetical protein